MHRVWGMELAHLPVLPHMATFSPGWIEILRFFRARRGVLGGSSVLLPCELDVDSVLLLESKVNLSTL
jgi:hypothetical protein